MFSLPPVAKSTVAALGFVLTAFTAVPAAAEDIRTTVFAGGCFWCVESDFEAVPGVIEAVSGFSGGASDNPSYRDVTSGGTGHYEAVEITYDHDRVTYEQLVHMFFRSVDPTDAGGQFCDRGDSYRTALFVANDAERAIAQSQLNQAQQELGQTIVTPILNAGEFFPAAAYHQDYCKQTKIILTRFGPRSKAAAYKLYRQSCGRDARVMELWGDAAPFVHS